MNSIIVFRAICSFFYYNTIPLQEQVFSFLSIKIFWVFMRFMGFMGIYEHLCSNLQFISLPEEVGEFLLYIMLNQPLIPLRFQLAFWRKPPGTLICTG